MRPALLAGDRVVVLRWARARPGDVVAIRDPRRTERILVKRVERADAATVFVVGDDPAASTDSRHFGPVARRFVLGRAVYRYFPPDRAGRLQRHLRQGRPGSDRYDFPMLTSLDRILDDDYLAGLQDFGMDEVRARRDECQEIENALSYARRITQGRLDIVGAEIGRRAGGQGPSDLAGIVDRLEKGEMLGEHGRPEGFGRLPVLLAPGHEVDELIAEIEQTVDADILERLPELGDGEVRDLASRLEELERSMSSRRRAVFERIDALQAEVIRRYKSGAANVDTLLTEPS